MENYLGMCVSSCVVSCLVHMRRLELKIDLCWKTKIYYLNMGIEKATINSLTRVQDLHYTLGYCKYNARLIIMKQRR